MSRESRLLLWLALVVAFSPVLFDLLSHLVDAPWARYCLLAVPLVAVATLREDEPAEVGSDGYGWLALGLALEIFALAVDAPRLARPGIGFAVMGLYRAYGFGPMRVAVLALWITPVPSQLVRLLSPALESALLAVAVRPVAAFMSALSVDGLRLEGPTGALTLTPWDAGLPLAGLLSCLGWYRGLGRGAGWRPPLAGAVVGGLAALPLQAVALAVAAALTAAGSPDTARSWLDHGMWLLAGSLGLGWIEWEQHRRRHSHGRGAGVSGMAFASFNSAELKDFEFRPGQADEGRDG